MPLSKPKLVDGWTRLWKSYSVIFSAANVLQAISVTGLSVLGVINVYFAFKLVVGMAALFGVLGLVGRLLAQKSLKVDPAEVTTEEPTNGNSN
jgi:hypothetical protein